MIWGNRLQTVYVKIDRNVQCPNPLVTLGDIAKLECANPQILPALKNLKIIRFQEKNQLEIFGILKVFQIIHKEYPDYELVNVGETDFVLQYSGEQMPHPIWDMVKLVFLCILIFFGAAFTIMAFNNDISIVGVFDQLYQQFMGTKKPDLSVLEIGYSIGLGGQLVLAYMFVEYGEMSLCVRFQCQPVRSTHGVVCQDAVGCAFVCLLQQGRKVALAFVC